MNRVLMVVGEVAKKPYYFDKIYLNIYTAEELCYCLYENAFLLDRDIVNKKLADWINSELKLPDLARDLYALINQNANISSFVGCILSYVGYYSADEIEKAESILRINVTLNVFEKWKAKADFLYENKHYLLAISEYEHVLSTVSEDEFKLRSEIYNNMGVTYMAISLYEAAMNCFLKAYEIDNNELAYKHYLTAKRLKLSEDDYIKFVAEDESSYRMSIPIEGELEDAKREFEDSDEARRLKQLCELKDNEEARLYYEEIAVITEKLKADYRDVVLEADKAGIYQ